MRTRSPPTRLGWVGAPAVLAVCLLPSCAGLLSWDGFASQGRPDAGVDAAIDARPDSGDAGGPGIAFVQASEFAIDDETTDKVEVRFNQPQGAGDLNVVAVGWYSLGAQIEPQPAGVVDSLGNTYTLAVGPTVQGSGRDVIVQS